MGEKLREKRVLFRREDFAKNKMRWVGEFWADLWYFSINTNPFLAMCYSHPLHPVGRTERYIITLFQVFFVMIVSCGLGADNTLLKKQFSSLKKGSFCQDKLGTNTHTG